MDEKEKTNNFQMMAEMMSGCCKGIPDFSSCCPPSGEKTESGTGASTDDKSEKKEE